MCNFESQSALNCLNLKWQGIDIRGHRIFLTSKYQGIVKATGFGAFEDLKFKISEGYKQN